MAFECIFCGATAEPSKEHVVSADTRDEFQIAGPVPMVIGNEAEPSKVQQNLAVILRDQICRTCNGVWMNQLEERVRPFFHTMMLNSGTVDLDRSMQIDFARWATVKAFIIERVIRKQMATEQTVEGYEGGPVELAWLAHEPTPLPRSRVWVGAFDAEKHVVLTYRASMCVSPDGTPAHVTTVTWGYCVFQVFTTDFVSADAADDAEFPIDPPTPSDKVVKRVWPTTSQVIHWPGENYIARSDLDVLITWGGILA